MKQKEFMKNAATMTVTALILRAIGIFFRIYLSGRIGAEGMGLYQLIFSVYVLASTFASSGICTAVTRLITDELVCGTCKTVKRILRRTTVLSIVIGILSALLIGCAAQPIGTYLLQDTRAVPSLKILGISLPCRGLSSCLRGYLMARRKSLLPSVSQLAEQIARILLIVLFLNFLEGHGIAYSCFAVILGDSLAEILSACILSAGYVWDVKHIKNLQPSVRSHPTRGILHRVLSIAAPITAGRYLNSALRTVENILVPQKLAVSGGSSAEALSSFGMLKGMALPLLFFPSSFLSSLSTLLIPELSEAHTLGHKQKVEKAVCKALKLTLLISVLLGGLFTYFAYDLGELLYQSTEVGFLLRVLAPLMPIMYLESIVDGMLKGLNQQVSSLWYSILDSGSRILLILILVPGYGMGGFLLIMIFSNLLTSFLNLQRLLNVTGIRMRWGQWIVKPTLAVSLAGVLVFWCNRYLPLHSVYMRITAGSLLICGIYLLLVVAMGCINKNDLLGLKPRRSF